MCVLNVSSNSQDITHNVVHAWDENSNTNSTVIYDDFNFDTISNGYWEYFQHNGAYEISDSKLRLYIPARIKDNANSVIKKTINISESGMMLVVRVKGITLYRFGMGWELSDRYILFEFNEKEFCVTSMIGHNWSLIGILKPKPSPNIWYILKFVVKPPFTIVASVYDENDNLLDEMTRNLDWNYSDIRRIQGAGVWTDSSANPLSDYYVDNILVGSLKKIRRVAVLYDPWHKVYVKDLLEKMDIVSYVDLIYLPEQQINLGSYDIIIVNWDHLPSVSQTLEWIRENHAKLNEWVMSGGLFICEAQTGSFIPHSESYAVISQREVSVLEERVNGSVTHVSEDYASHPLATTPNILANEDLKGSFTWLYWDHNTTDIYNGIFLNYSSDWKPIILQKDNNRKGLSGYPVLLVKDVGKGAYMLTTMFIGGSRLYKLLENMVSYKTWPIRTPPKMILIDEAHSERLTSGNMQKLIQNLEKEGYDVVSLDQAINSSVLEDCGVLIIGTAWSSFTPDEIKEIERFVKKGGGLLLTGVGWSWVAHHPERSIEDFPMNRIAQRFGAFFNPDTISDPTDFIENPSNPKFHLPFIENHPVTSGVSIIGAAGAIPCSISFQRGECLITGDEDAHGDEVSPYSQPGMRPPFLVAIEWGLGRIVLVGHEYLFEDDKIHYLDNEVLAMNIIHWLLRREIVDVIVHDISVVTLFLSSENVDQGELVYIGVVVANEGTEDEVFNVITYYGEKIIGLKNDVLLEAGRNLTLTFTWDTANVSPGNYTIKAEASMVSGETDIEDNVKVYGMVKVNPKMPWWLISSFWLILIGVVVFIFVFTFAIILDRRLSEKCEASSLSDYI